MSGDPARRALDLSKRGSVACYRVQSGKGIDHPVVLACIELFVDAGNTDGAALFVAQREAECAVSPGHHSGILADIKRAVRDGDKMTNKSTHILSGCQRF